MSEQKAAWINQLQSGETLRPAGSTGFYFSLALTVMGTLFLLFVWAQVLLFLFTGKPNDWAPDDLGGKIVLPIFSLAWFAVAAFVWGNMFTKLRFSEEALCFQNWRGKNYQINFREITTLVWSMRSSNENTSRKLRLCHRPNGAVGKDHWLDLDYGQWRGEFSEAVREELVGRCGLMVLGKPGENSDDTVWVSPKLGEQPSGQYCVTGYLQHLPFFMGLAFIISAMVLWIGVPYHWYGITGPRFPFLVSLPGLCLIGLAIIWFFWLKSRTLGRTHDLVGVAWEERGVTLHPRRFSEPGQIAFVPWQNLTRVTAPTCPNGGYAKIHTDYDDKPFSILLTENEDCFAFLAQVQKHRTIAWGGK